MDMDILLLIGAVMEETLTPQEKRARDKLAAAIMSDTAKQLEREFREARASKPVVVKQPKSNAALVNRVLAALEEEG